MLRKRLLRGGAWLTAGNALSAGASFLRNIMIARLVSVEDFGIVVLLSLILSTVEIVGNLAVERLLVQASDGDDPVLQATAHALQVVRGVIGALIVFLSADWIATLFKIPQATWALQILSLVPAIRSLIHLDTVRYQREMRFKPTFWVDVFPQALSLVVAVPLAYWLRDYSAIVWSMLAQALAQTMTTHAMASRSYGWVWDRKTMIRILSFGWPLMANALLMLIIFQGDKAVIAIGFSTEVVGWYGVAFMLSMAPAMLVTSVMQGLLLPVLSNCQDMPEEFKHRYNQVVQACLAVGLLTAAAFAVFGPELLVALFGGRYRDGTEVVILLGMTQGVRIAKAGQFVSALALGSTTIPMIANLARGAALLAAIGLVSIGYGPVAVAIMGLVGEMVSYVIGTHLLAIRVRSPVIHQLPLIGVWLALAGMSWAVGAELRGLAPSLMQFILGVVWFSGVAVLFISVSAALRRGLLKFFRGGSVGGRK
jgi:O-antigen/teichoic acid export membrane protein